MSLSHQLATVGRFRPARWVLLPLTVGFVLSGVPAQAAPAPADTVITGTVSFHEAYPDRTVEVFRQDGSAWIEDAALETSAASNGRYTVHAPAGVPVRLRVSYGDQDYGYWYGDGFEADTATPVQGAGGATVTGVDLDVPAPGYVTGRVTDRDGNPLAATVVPAVNNDGGLRPLTAQPIATSSTGEYTVILPAVYETGILGVSLDGTASDWLGGGSMSEPNFYINLTAGEQRQAEDLVLPVGTQSSSATPAVKPAAKPAAATRLKATSSPVVRGTARKGSILRANAGRWNLTPTTIRYQWLRNGAAIRGATRSAYRIVRKDVRKRISLKVTVSRTGVRSAASAFAAPTARVRKH
jgi:hypothetical protein